MALATFNLEAIDRALTDAVADPHADPQAQTDRMNYLLDRRLMVMHG